MEKDAIFIIWLCKQQKEDTLLLIVSTSVLCILTPLNRKTHKAFTFLPRRVFAEPPRQFVCQSGGSGPLWKWASLVLMRINSHLTAVEGITVEEEP